MSEKETDKPDKEHDEVVLKAGEFLSSKDYDVRADHVGEQERKENGFERPLKLVAPPLLLSAFVPTKAIFSPSRKYALLDPDWKKPDLVVTRDGFTYVLDVLGGESPITMTARKFETVIANCEDHKIVGIAFIEIPSKYDGKKKEFERLRKTFNRRFKEPSDVKLSGESIDDKCPELFRDVKSLFSNKFCQDIYGEIQWDKVLVITYDKDKDNWEKALCCLHQHVEETLNAKTLLVKKQT